MATKTIDEQIAALDTRITADTEKRDRLRAAKDAQETLDNLAKGIPVFYLFGRGETRGKFAGVVVDVVDTDKGRVILVMKGEGVDMQVVRIKPQDVIGEFKDVQEAAAGEQSAEPQGAAADPLAGLV